MTKTHLHDHSRSIGFHCFVLLLNPSKWIFALFSPIKRSIRLDLQLLFLIGASGILQQWLIFISFPGALCVCGQCDSLKEEVMSHLCFEFHHPTLRIFFFFKANNSAQELKWKNELHRGCFIIHLKAIEKEGCFEARSLKLRWVQCGNWSIS